LKPIKRGYTTTNIAVQEGRKLEAAHHVLAASAELERDQPNDNMGSSWGETDVNRPTAQKTSHMSPVGAAASWIRASWTIRDEGENRRL
jgi:hypothetical protein